VSDKVDLTDLTSRLKNAGEARKAWTEIQPLVPDMIVEAYDAGIKSIDIARAMFVSESYVHQVVRRNRNK
jgi:hypothetical protein